MELDLKSVKALASPTRIKILRKSMESEATPTSLADELGRSKSTISSHLEKLTEAELLEKDSKEGRRRVVYHPTSKAEAIASGKERKVRFSLATSGLTAFTGIGLLGYGLVFRSSSDSAASGPATMQSQEAGMAAMDTARTASETGVVPNDVLLVAGLGFLSIALGSIIYGLVMQKIGR